MTGAETSEPSLIPIWAGPGSDAGPILDRLLDSGRFDESDIDVAPEGKGLTFVTLVPDYDESSPVSGGRRRLLLRVYELPLYRYVVRIAGGLGVEIQDDSETYTHRLFAIRYKLGTDQLVFDANPPFVICVAGARETLVEVFRSPSPVEVDSLRTFGPIEIE